MSYRVVALGSTFRFFFSTRRFSSGASFTIADLTVDVYEDDNGTQITAADTPDNDYDSVTGFHQVAIAATAGNGFEAGKWYTCVISGGTVDSVSVVGQKVYEFRIETAAELAAREFNEKMFPNHVVATTTSNDTTHINLAEIVDADMDDDELNGEVLAVWDATDGQIVLVRVTDYVKSTTLATVENLRGGVLPFTVAANDMVWRYGQFSAKSHALANLALDAGVNVTQINGATVTGAGTSGDKWRAA
jgi:hypothetical protein